MAYSSMLKEVIEEKLYLPGSVIDVMLKEEREKGRIEGKAQERMMGKFAFSLRLLKGLPYLSNLQIAKLSKSKEKFVADIKEIVTQNTAVKFKEIVFEKFFKDLNLDEEGKMEVMEDIDYYYKKD